MNVGVLVKMLKGLSHNKHRSSFVMNINNIRRETANKNIILCFNIVVDVSSDLYIL